jgi:hypothetical protein
MKKETMTLADFRRESNPALYGRGKNKKYKFYFGFIPKNCRYKYEILPFAGTIEEGDFPQANKEKSLREAFAILQEHEMGKTEDIGNKYFSGDKTDGIIKEGEFKISLIY